MSAKTVEQIIGTMEIGATRTGHAVTNLEDVKTLKDSLQANAGNVKCEEGCPTGLGAYCCNFCTMASQCTHRCLHSHLYCKGRA